MTHRLSCPPEKDTLLKTNSWVGWFKYSFIESESGWYYAHANKWRFNGKSAKKQARKLKELWVPLTTRLMALKISTTDEQEILRKDPQFLNWLISEGAEGLRISERLSPIILNNVVTSETLKTQRLLSTLNGPHVTIHVCDLPLRQPCWSYEKYIAASWAVLLEENALAYPDLFFKTKNFKSLKSETDLLNIIDRYFSSFRVLHERSILNYKISQKNIEISVEDRVTMAPYNKGRLCVCIPVPGLHRHGAISEPLSVKTHEVVVSSPNVSDVLTRLSQIWQDRFAKSILISAPPGSGKEVFAMSIPFGNGRTIKEIPSISLATGVKQEQEEKLYGRQRTDGSIEEGLIEESRGSAIFLDEVHCPVTGPSVRDSLLRPLESGDYFPLGSSKPRKVDDVLFILATSKPLAGI